MSACVLNLFDFLLLMNKVLNLWKKNIDLSLFKLEEAFQYCSLTDVDANLVSLPVVLVWNWGL